jgi:hypothetical protein
MPPPADRVIITAIATVVAYALPFFAVRHDATNLLTLLIIFFGLQQAWRMTRKSRLSFRGPFRVGQGDLPALGVTADG